MRAGVIVLVQPLIDDDLGLLWRREPFNVEHLSAQSRCATIIAWPELVVPDIHTGALVVAAPRCRDLPSPQTRQEMQIAECWTHSSIRYILLTRGNTVGKDHHFPTPAQDTAMVGGCIGVRVGCWLCRIFDKAKNIVSHGEHNLTGRPSVIDGDTIDIRNTSIRLYGIDAPESGQPCGDASGKAYTCGSKAAFALADRIGQGNVSCEARDRDSYGRIVAVCFLTATGEDVNAFLVRSGWALAYRHYSSDDVDEEDVARRAKRGLWAGAFTPPWEYRNGTAKLVATPTGSSGCRIKGNISKNGHIYHVPGSRWYSRTRIDTRKGERWFCSEAEARAAGWRAPRN